jgi:signal transduction histidine kinase
MVCIDRTRRLAIEQERNRIARDIHDTIAQSLFGMVFSLDACIAMLPEQVDSVIKELGELRALASRVREEVRQSIFDLWPGELDLERFKSDLNVNVSQCCHPQAFQINFTTSGDFDRLSPLIRRTLYRITQEALINAARHSGVRSAQVCLGIEAGQVHLCVRDQGRGFDLQAMGIHPREQGGFGLSGIKTRVSALGGDIAVLSQEDQGTMILASLPCTYEGSSEF